MKLNLIIISFPLLLGIYSCKSELRKKHLVAKDLKINSNNVELIKIDSTFLETQDSVILKYLSEINNCDSQYVDNEFTLYNYLSNYQILIHISQNRGEALQKMTNTAFNSEKYYLYREQVKQIHAYIDSVDSIYNLIGNRLRSLGIECDYFPLELPNLDTLDLYFSQNKENEKSYIYKFDEENKKIKSRVEYKKSENTSL